jgi:hypothetical protein
VANPFAVNRWMRIGRAIMLAHVLTDLTDSSAGGNG